MFRPEPGILSHRKSDFLRHSGFGVDGDFMRFTNHTAVFFLYLKKEGGIVRCSRAVQRYGYFNRFIGDVRIYLYIVYIKGRFGCQADHSDHTVPVRLCMVGNAVCIYADFNIDPIVYAKGERMFSGCQLFERMTIGSRQ